jgi:acylphosphatase
VPIPESRCHAFVSGIVQGVGFRYFVRDEAVKAGAVGWVRNLHDGRVEFIAEGTTSGLQALMKQVRRGPLGGRVVISRKTGENPPASSRRSESNGQPEAPAGAPRRMSA